MSPDVNAKVSHAILPNTPSSLLVVDDEEMNRDVLWRRLSREGYAVDVAKDGPTALNMMRVERYDLILLDIMMPEMDGYQVLQTIKNDALLQKTPVIMLTAMTDMRAKDRCIKMGACDYMEKPFKFALLKSVIWNCFRKNNTSNRNSSIKGSLDGLSVLIVDDEEMNRDLLSRRTRQLGLIPYCANSGPVALSIMEQQKIDLVLLDIMMAKMDGYEVLSRIRANEAFKNIPVIMISALGETNNIEQCMRLGANYYIVKPFNSVLLKEKLISSLEVKQASESALEEIEKLTQLASLGQAIKNGPDS